MTVLNLLPFCLFSQGGKTELGIAQDGYFASTAWRLGDEAYRTISGTSFGWRDMNTDMYKDNKHNFIRPTQTQVLDMIKRPEYTNLRKLAIREKLLQD